MFNNRVGPHWIENNSSLSLIVISQLLKHTNWNATDCRTAQQKQSVSEIIISLTCIALCSLKWPSEHRRDRRPSVFILSRPSLCLSTTSSNLMMRRLSTVMVGSGYHTKFYTHTPSSQSRSYLKVMDVTCCCSNDGRLYWPPPPPQTPTHSLICFFLTVSSSTVVFFSASNSLPHDRLTFLFGILTSKSTGLFSAMTAATKVVFFSFPNLISPATHNKLERLW